MELHPTLLRCSSYWEGSFRVALDYGRQLLLTYYTKNFYESSSNLEQTTTVDSQIMKINELEWANTWTVRNSLISLI